MMLLTREEMLKEGEQTRITPTVEGMTAAFEEFKDSRIFDVKINPMRFTKLAYQFAFQYINHPDYIPYHKRTTQELKDRGKKLWKSNVRQRSVEQIIDQGTIRSCSDDAVLARTIAISKGIPTAFIEAVHKTYLMATAQERENWGNKPINHAFLRIQVSPTRSYFLYPDNNQVRIYTNQFDIYKNEGMIIQKEGIDSWALRIKDYKDIKTFIDANSKQTLLYAKCLNLELIKREEEFKAKINEKLKNS